MAATAAFLVLDFTTFAPILKKLMSFCALVGLFFKANFNVSLHF